MKIWVLLLVPLLFSGCVVFGRGGQEAGVGHSDSRDAVEDGVGVSGGYADDLAPLFPAKEASLLPLEDGADGADGADVPGEAGLPLPIPGEGVEATAQRQKVLLNSSGRMVVVVGKRTERGEEFVRRRAAMLRAQEQGSLPAAGMTGEANGGENPPAPPGTDGEMSAGATGVASGDAPEVGVCPAG